MEESGLKTLIITQAVVIGGFLIKQMVEWILHMVRRKSEKEEDTIESFGKQFQELQIKMATLQAQLEIVMKQLFVVGKLENDLDRLFQKLRTNKDL